ncbi:hypothetical protein BKA67DRAFT_527875 [Truncatella angustata]|uniref:ABC transporter domain-containing protein n=1 Tax=Truncatella angustata TaxID=152316 RepID=A0A9P8REQ8_9PEZI|nr:uncharacterized protein BKA67DRAFT_527875 [Truncatella angustata]KAH6643247.1 hypothetical protein BKA67DRAFT_527875 [Truncatella angustata]
MTAPQYNINAADLPQDPFIPQAEHTTPSFLDTGACVCALRTTPDDSGQDSVTAWQCIGNQTQNVYEATTGKWFNTLHGGSTTSLPIYDASNGPNTATTFQWDAAQDRLVEASGQTGFDIYDRACTAVNQTTFTTAFYRTKDAIARNETLVDAAPCYRGPEAIPIRIQTAEEWEEKGCLEGFLCANNTVNSLPQYCPPVTDCQTSRLFGQVCQLSGTNIGMGPFEPIVCQAGNYCPAPGNKMIPCPAGSYCQPGAATPTPCDIGSRCPEGSVFQRNLIPVIVLLAIDVAILVGIIVHGLRNRFRRTTSAHSASLNNSAKVPLRAMSVKASGYSRLDDETEHDQEMLPMEDTYMPRGDAWHGFHAVLDMDFSRGMWAEELENAQGMTPQLRSFVESMRKATDAAHFGLSFTYSNLSFQPRNSARMILQNVTGSIERGTVTAVMGGSGAGKSTFVNVLMGKTNQTGGSVAINGVPGKLKRYKKLIGYVPQDDIVLPELTVYENILHSARIRLPRTWKDRDVVAHVNSVIDCLELSHVKDSLVGTVGKPVISGGQRKRVSIGMELAAAPMAIFLDEPTSGLDATAASSIMATLKAIARLGISVIVIIHQPRMEIFEMLDNLVLLGNGQLIYEGPEADVRLFFESIGYRFPAHSNYGDVVTDIITGNGRAYKSSGNISRESLIDYWASSHHRSTRNSRAESIISVSSSSMSKVLRTRGASRLKQLWLCLRRAMLQQSRSIVTFWSEMLLASIAGFLIGLAENSKNGVLFTGLYNPPFEILSVAMDIKSTPETSLLVAIAIGLVAAAPGVKVFSEEMLVQRRESEAGHSRLAYFLAKSASVVPRMLLACLHFTTWFMLLSVPIISWNLAFLVNLLYFYCIYGLASFLSMILRREDAPLFATMISLIVGVLCGAAPPLSNVKKWHLEWLWRASPGVWLAEIYFGQMVAPYEYLYNTKLAAANMGFHLDWFQRNLAVLLGIGTLYRLLAYVGLFAGKGIRL